MTPEELLAPYPPHLRELAEALRSLVKRAVPTAIEAVRPGWRLLGYNLPIGKRTPFFAWVWPEFEHVHLGFEHGILLDDPDRVLRGAHLRLKRVRYLTMTDAADIDTERCRDFLRQTAQLAGLSRAERVGRLLDRDDRG